MKGFCVIKHLKEDLSRNVKLTSPYSNNIIVIINILYNIYRNMYSTQSNKRYKANPIQLNRWLDFL